MEREILDSKKKHLFKQKYIVIFFLFLAFSLWFGFIFFEDGPNVDEKVHERQIDRFHKGNYDTLSNLTTLPGYHLAVFSISKISGGFNSTRSYRIISLLLSSFSIILFYLIAKKFDNKKSIQKTLQYVFFPITFLYFPLIYTDIFSLTLVLASFYFSLNKKYKLSALFSLSSLLVRQINIVWIFFIWIYCYFQEYGYNFSKEKIIEYIKKTFSQLVVFVLFLFFILLNKGIAIGDRGAHEFGFHLGNIFFIMALIGLFFIPLLPTFLKRIKKINYAKIYTGLVIALLILIILYIFPMELHSYNNKMNFLRNIALNFFYNQSVSSYAGMVLIGSFILLFMKFQKYSFLLAVVCFLCLSSSFLIEQRYYIIPLVFMLLLRKQEDKRSESLLFFYFIILSIGLTFMMLKTGMFF